MADNRLAADGDSVKVHYTGTLDNGEVFDSSREREPLPFTVGSGQVISGFDEAVRGLAVGSSRTVRMEPAQAYGEHDEDLLVTIPLTEAPDGIKDGDQVRLGDRPALVTAVGDETVTVDANHPLAVPHAVCPEASEVGELATRHRRMDGAGLRLQCDVLDAKATLESLRGAHQDRLSHG
ncbi:MAG TPA: FKBP-type peptidyl-prolyl cis-trans isomerase [Dehalococcoidia bacterium]|nr:FKBP-type peptidyl-prolyl cis-trans isomerase [Dehalococcoidia bacterium]